MSHTRLDSYEQVRFKSRYFIVIENYKNSQRMMNGLMHSLMTGETPSQTYNAILLANNDDSIRMMLNLGPSLKNLNSFFSSIHDVLFTFEGRELCCCINGVSNESFQKFTDYLRQSNFDSAKKMLGSEIQVDLTEGGALLTMAFSSLCEAMKKAPQSVAVLEKHDPLFYDFTFSQLHLSILKTASQKDKIQTALSVYQTGPVLLPPPVIKSAAAPANEPNLNKQFGKK